MRPLLFLAIVLTATTAFGALSPTLHEWGTGPAQWIMTADEKRAWRKIATDSDAVNFIDLFWARRDPSSGTAANELRNEFESRVAFADEKFSEKRKRGAMTDRGRVYIVLGPSTNTNTELRQMDAQQNIDIGPNQKMRQRGKREIWLWNHADAQKFGMPKIEVVFIEEPSTRRVERDPTRADFGLAEARALKLWITNPELTAVPEWAATGGLEPQGRVITYEVPFSASTPAPTSSPQPAVASTTPGVSQLTLGSGRDFPWTVQYCAAKAEVPRLKYLLFMQGPLDGKATEQRTREKDATPQPMAANPGCYVLRGTVPAAKLAPGRYKLTVFIDDVGTGGSHTIKGEFRVE